MTNPAPRTMQLNPADWRALVLLNVEQLGQFIASIPANDDKGNSGLTDEAIAMIESHVARGQQLLGGWRRARIAMAPVQQAEQPAPQPEAPKANGAHEAPKRRGGWPAGKPRGRRAQTETRQ